jgi:hypothetical protein
LIEWWWSYALTLVGVTGVFLAGRKDWRGWAVGILSEIVWIIYAIVTMQYGFIFGALAYGAVFTKNLIEWIGHARQQKKVEKSS